MTLPPEREGYDAPPVIVERRVLMAQALASGVWNTSPPPIAEQIGPVPVLRWLPEGTPRGRVIHFHGGAYRMGCPEMEGHYACALARDAGVEVIVPRYRLAPEAPFPAALNDAFAVLDATADDLPLILSGGSAGGGLAAALALLAREPGRELAGLVMHSPWLDLTVSAPSFDKNAASDTLFSRAAAELAAELYLQGQSAGDPYASPALASLAGLPPVLLTAGTVEVLHNDAVVFAAELEAQSVPCRLLVIDGMEHVAITRSRDAVGSAESFAATVDFVNQCLA